MIPRIMSFKKTVIFILSPDNLENAMVKGHLDQGIKASELSPGLRFGSEIFSNFSAHRFSLNFNLFTNDFLFLT